MWHASTLVMLCSAICASIFLPTGINNKTKAPFCVPNSTAPQQHLLIVQGIFLSSKSKSSCELIQFVIWSLTFDFTCKRRVKKKKEILAQKDVNQRCILSCSPGKESVSAVHSTPCRSHPVSYIYWCFEIFLLPHILAIIQWTTVNLDLSYCLNMAIFHRWSTKPKLPWLLCGWEGMLN